MPRSNKGSRVQVSSLPTLHSLIRSSLLGDRAGNISLSPEAPPNAPTACVAATPDDYPEGRVTA
jgi:hypothetical protein